MTQEASYKLEEPEHPPDPLRGWNLQGTEMTGHLSGGCLNPTHRVLRELGTHHAPQPEGQERGGQALLSRTNSHSASNGR